MLFPVAVFSYLFANVITSCNFLLKIPGIFKKLMASRALERKKADASPAPEADIYPGLPDTGTHLMKNPLPSRGLCGPVIFNGAK